VPPELSGQLPQLPRPRRNAVVHSSGAEVAASFFNPDGFGTSCVENGFDQAELVNTLITHVRSPDPAVSLRAIPLFLSTAAKSLEAAGAVKQATQTTRTPDGRVTTLTATRIILESPDVDQQRDPQCERNLLPASFGSADLAAPSAEALQRHPQSDSSERTA
jgi:hypothetical protein